MAKEFFIKTIDESWSESGFLGKLRDGIFDRTLYNELYSSLLRLRYEENEIIERHVIRILWFIPIFMFRQKEYIDSISSDTYDELREQLEEAIANIFGYP